MRMSAHLLVQYLQDLGFSNSDYSVGEERDNTRCLIREGNSWVVFFSERGSRFDDVVFDSEKVACLFFLGLFTQSYIERGGTREQRPAKAS